MQTVEFFVTLPINQLFFPINRLSIGEGEKIVAILVYLP